MTKDTILAHEVRTDSEIVLRFMESVFGLNQKATYVCMSLSLHIYTCDMWIHM